MLKELWKDIPMTFKVLWIGGMTASAGLTGFAIWAVYTVVTHITATP